MGVGQLSESDAVDALRLPFYSSSHPTGSHGWRNQFDLGNPDSKDLPDVPPASPLVKGDTDLRAIASFDRHPIDTGLGLRLRCAHQQLILVLNNQFQAREG